jgi:CRISPR/Cas system-associated exonuclease Cas4 (RecB family)
MVVRGQIDLWFEERNGGVIVDYKTDDVAAGDAHSRAEAYQLQLRYYALAVEKLTGSAPAEAWLHFLRPDVAVRVDVGASKLADARRVIADLAAAQRSLVFPLREAAHCLRCPFYRGKCPAGSAIV